MVTVMDCSVGELSSRVYQWGDSLNYDSSPQTEFPTSQSPLLQHPNQESHSKAVEESAQTEMPGTKHSTSLEQIQQQTGVVLEEKAPEMDTASPSDAGHSVMQTAQPPSSEGCKTPGARKPAQDSRALQSVPQHVRREGLFAKE